MQPSPPCHRRAGFTLVELLVVIGVVAVLIAILLPALRGARRAAQRAQCGAQLHQIHTALQLYAGANGGYVARAPNRATWITIWKPPDAPGPALRLIHPQAVDAYWGVAYLPYLASRATVESTGDAARSIVDFARAVWHCPASVSVDGAFTDDPESPVSYGLNACVSQGTSRSIADGKGGLITVRVGAKLSRFRCPAGVIFCHDAAEQLLENRQKNTLSAYGIAGGTNLTDWRPGGIASGLYKADALSEFYRHGRASQTLWLDGHVSMIPSSDGQDVPPIWYEGK